MAEYTSRVNIGTVDVDTYDIDRFHGYGGVLSRGPFGTNEITLTVDAASLGDAVMFTLALVEARGDQARGIQTMKAKLYDRGYADPSQDGLTVNEAAERLGVSPQAIRQRLASGSLPGERHGRAWVIPKSAVK